MLKKKFRLRERKDINLLLKNGVYAKGAFFAMRILPREHANCPARITVVIGKKQQKNAVRRNFIKRRTREVVKRQLHSLAGYDVIVFPFVQAAQARFTELVSDLSFIFRVGKDRSAHYRGISKDRIAHAR